MEKYIQPLQTEQNMEISNANFQNIMFVKLQNERQYLEKIIIIYVPTTTTHLFIQEILIDTCKIKYVER